MENYEIALMSDELYHHGIKGMKWGIRRYQNKDGSLTNAGKKRRSLGETVHDYKVNKQRKKSLEKARAAKEKKAEAERKHKEAFEKGKLSPKKMTNEELAAATKRLQDEQKYQEAMLETRPMKRLMDKTWKDAIVPGITKGGEELVKKAMLEYGGEALGLNKKEAKSAAELAKEKYTELDYKKKIQDLTRPKTELEKLTEEYDLRKKQKDLDDLNKSKDDITERTKKLDDEAKLREAERKHRNANDPEYMNQKTEAEKADFQNKINKAKKGEVYDEDGNTVDDSKGSNQSKNDKGAKQNKESTKSSFDANTNTTALSTAVINRGRSYVDNNNGRRYRVDPDGTIEYVD